MRIMIEFNPHNLRKHIDWLKLTLLRSSGEMNLPDAVLEQIVLDMFTHAHFAYLATQEEEKPNVN